MLTFEHLEQKYGSVAAHCWLMEIEKTVRIRSSEVASIDPELRLLNALRAQDILIQSLQQAA